MIQIIVRVTDVDSGSHEEILCNSTDDAGAVFDRKVGYYKSRDPRYNACRPKTVEIIRKEVIEKTLEHWGCGNGADP